MTSYITAPVGLGRKRTIFLFVTPLLSCIAFGLCAISETRTFGQSCLQWVNRSDIGSPGQRSHHAMVYDSDRGVSVLFGGQIGNPGSVAYLQGTQEYDGNSWKQI